MNSGFGTSGSRCVAWAAHAWAGFALHRLFAAKLGRSLLQVPIIATIRSSVLR